MSAPELLRTVVVALDQAEIPHMLVGSFASGIHGATRSTQDVDLVIDPTPQSLAVFTASLDRSDVYVGPSPQEALARRDQFNAIDGSSGWKVDLIIRKDRPFSRSEFDRRSAATLLGLHVWVATAEDTVLSKLEWAATSGGSDRQMADAAGVLAVAETLDEEYLDRWAAVLGVSDLLERARAG